VVGGAIIGSALARPYYYDYYGPPVLCRPATVVSLAAVASPSRTKSRSTPIAQPWAIIIGSALARPYYYDYYGPPVVYGPPPVVYYGPPPAVYAPPPPAYAPPPQVTLPPK
jgi:hypothetical protein